MKIVLSGIGLLSPAGNNYHSFIESIYAGTSFVSLENELSQYGTRCEVSSRIQNFKLSSNGQNINQAPLFLYNTHSIQLSMHIRMLSLKEVLPHILAVFLFPPR